MRYLATPSFSEKASRSSPAALSEIGAVLTTIEKANKETLEATVEPLANAGGLYMIKRPPVHLFVSFGRDKEGDYVLLADLIDHAADAGYAGVKPLPSRDPRLNSLLDPRRNSLIDPRRNSLIDPQRNSLIDPLRNSLIDPRRNSLIDPRRNSLIDLRRNSLIDPRRNSLIDPKRNSLIDPRRNRIWSGPYLYHLDARIVGFVVRANERVALIFDPKCDLIGSLISNGRDGYNVFAMDGAWRSFFASNQAEGFNQFDINRKWIGFSVWEAKTSG